MGVCVCVGGWGACNRLSIIGERSEGERNGVVCHIPHVG